MAFNFAEGIATLTAKADGFMLGMNQINKGMKDTEGKVTTSVNRIEETFRKLGNYLAGFVGFSVLTRSVVNSVKEYASFEQVMKNAGSVSNATAQELIMMSDAARELSKQFPLSAAEIGQGFYYVASAGYSATEQIKAMKGITTLAAATLSDMAFATETVTAVLSIFGMDASESSRVADVYAKAISSSQANIEKLAGSMRYAGPIAKSMGMDFESTVAVLTQLYDAGLRGEQAGTALRGAIAQLSKPTEDAIKVLTQYGLTINDVNPKVLPFIKILENIQKAGIPASEAIALVGTEAGVGFATLIGNSTEKINDMKIALVGAGGTADRVAKEQMGTLEGKLKQLNNLWTDFKFEIVENVVPALNQVLPLLSKFIDYLGTAYEFWNTTETEATQKRILAIKTELNNMANWVGLSEKQIARRGELLNKLRDEEALLRIITGESKKAAAATEDSTKQMIQLWKDAHKGTKNLGDKIISLAGYVNEYGVNIGEATGSTAKFGESMFFAAGGTEEAAKRIQELTKNVKEYNELPPKRTEIKGYVTGEYYEGDLGDKTTQAYQDDMGRMVQVTQEGTENIKKTWQQRWDEMGSFATSTIDTVSSSFGSGVSQMIMNSESFGDTFEGIIKSIEAAFINMIITMMIKMALLSAVGGPGGGLGAFMGFSQGGFTDKGPGSLPHIPRAQHGLITKGYGTQDNILAFLRPKELVAPFSYVKELVGTMVERFLNTGQMPAMAPSKSTSNNIQIIVNNPANIEDLIGQIERNPKRIIMAINKGRFGYG